MTTVAFDGRYLAADTMGHRSGVPSNTLTPKIAVRDGFAYAINGSWMPMINVLIEWHRAGAKFNEFPEIKTGGGMMIVELAMRRVWLVSGEVPAPDEEAAPITAGSGGDIALGALHAGKTAMEAVQIAAKCDIHTNDVIDFVDLEWPAKGVQRWDGHMPSARLPMPVQDDGGLKVRACIKRGTNSHTWVEHDPECDGTCGDQRVRGPIISVPDMGVSLKAEAHTLVDQYCEQDEEGRLRLVAHELTHMHNGRPLTTKADLCMHGFVRSTCPRCKHETYPYPAA